MVVAILAMLSNLVSSATISRDGNNFYTSKIIPINYYTQMFAKFTFNAIFTIGAIIVTAIISCFIYPVWQIILGSVAVIFASCGHIAWSIDMDVKNPTINMQGNEQASVTGKNTPKCLIGGLLIGFFMGMLIILTAGNSKSIMPYIILIVVSIIFAVYRVYTLILRINLAYDKIEM
jgi:ABC-2 type transport system permease protein